MPSNYILTVPSADVVGTGDDARPSTLDNAVISGLENVALPTDLSLTSFLLSSVVVNFTIAGIAAPVSTGALPDQTFTQNTGIQDIPTAGDFTGGDGDYTVTGPTGVTISTVTGVVSVDTTNLLSAQIITVTKTNVAGSAQSAFQVTVEVLSDTTAPTLSAFTWDDVTYTAGFTTDEAGTLIAATHDSTNTVTPNGSGGWTGTTIEIDSESITGTGPTDYIISFTSASQNADRISYYVRDAVGNDSAVRTEVFTYTGIVLSNFVDNLDQDPPIVGFDSNTAGTATWDFDTSATTPNIGTGNIATGTFAVDAGPNNITIDLTGLEEQTGYLYFRVTDQSNVLSSQVITVPGVQIAPAVITYGPADDATGVQPDSSLFIVFNKEMKPTTTTTVILKDVGGASIETFNSSTDGVWSATTRTNDTWTVTPTSEFVAGAAMAVQYSGFADRVNTTVAAVTDDTTWNFTSASGGAEVIEQTIPLFTDTSFWNANTNVTVTDTVITATAGAGAQASQARSSTSGLNLTAPGDYTLVFDLENMTTQFNLIGKISNMDTTPATIDVNFNFSTGNIDAVSDAGTVARMTAFGGGYTCEIDFSVTADGVGRVWFGLTEFNTTLIRLVDATGTESATITNQRIIQR